MTQTPSSTAPQPAVGETRLSLRSMERVVSAAIAEVPGTAQIDAKLAGLAGRAFPRLLVQMDPDTRMVAVDATIAVTWPAPVTDVAVAVRTSIREAVANHTGFSTTRVNVTVGGAVPGEPTTAEQLAAHSSRAARPPQVATPSSLHAIAVDSHGPVRSIEAPRPASVQGVQSPGEVQVRSVEAPRPAAVRHVDAPEPLRLRGVTTPAPVAVRHPQPTPTQPPLAPIVVRPSADQSYPVYAPQPQPLRAITITPYFDRRQP
ncbi:Asp23/Gls24 family envelope stress response protein [Corynebacterium sp.]|uniref:Asp23/Gls24 family envelope stress response protein n=1 Tax=Corynebacterium sp. TaxID=1720 RepID=UPI0026DBEDDA|nr:Asp23/Gls24 family envelope stress response protein [Corynebacterium sp.]MDO5032360.1 Asp23/Gls24 family envelope stress response protein [Corynebacterium sp.]